jgi:nicotinamide N-methyltransferase
VLILADLLFNHSEHAKLVKTVQLMLKKSPDSRAFVFFTPYRPWLLQKDLAFFDLAREAGFIVNKTFEKVMDKVMFEKDPGVSMLWSCSGLFQDC